MAKVNARSGSATATLSTDLSELASRLVQRARTRTPQLLVRELSPVADEAKAEWYRQVKEATGLSGQIEVRAFEAGDSVTVKIGSTDPRRINGKPVVVYVHRPGPLSLQERPATPEEYHQRLSAGMSPGRAYRVREGNPKASDGKFLLAELVKKPAQTRIRAIRQDFARLLKGGQ